MHPKTAIIYAYHAYTETVDYFFKHGVIDYPNVDYYIVENQKGRRGLVRSYHKLTESCVTTLKRSNTSRDFGAYAAGLREIEKSKKKYDYLAFINSTTMGPFSPLWNKTAQHYIHTFTQRLVHPIGITGISINYHHDNPHVQSMFFVIPHNVLAIVRSLFPDAHQDIPYDRLIKRHEIAMSQRLLQKHYNLDCLLTAFQNVDWRRPKDFEVIQKLEENYGCHDLWRKNNYFGSDIHPFETIFIKANKPHMKEAVSALTQSSAPVDVLPALKSLTKEELEPMDYRYEDAQELAQNISRKPISFFVALGFAVTFFVAFWILVLYVLVRKRT